jgi:hypothetical protein
MDYFKMEIASMVLPELIGTSHNFALSPTPLKHTNSTYPLTF